MELIQRVGVASLRERARGPP